MYEPFLEPDLGHSVSNYTANDGENEKAIDVSKVKPCLIQITSCLSIAFCKLNSLLI